MIRSWERWDEKHNSENDHPNEYSEKQVADYDNSIYYFSKTTFLDLAAASVLTILIHFISQRFVVFVQEHGGQDLESFEFQSFNEARSLLFQVCSYSDNMMYECWHILRLFIIQVTVALAVAEAAFEFEHRGLHWFSNLYIRVYSFIVFNRMTVVDYL